MERPNKGNWKNESYAYPNEKTFTIGASPGSNPLRTRRMQLIRARGGSLFGLQFPFRLMGRIVSQGRSSRGRKGCKDRLGGMQLARSVNRTLETGQHAERGQHPATKTSRPEFCAH